MATANEDVKKTLEALNTRSERRVVALGKSSGSWWREWSDGMIEQWIKRSVQINVDGKVTITLPKAYSGTDYVILALSSNPDKWSWLQGSFSDMKKESFVVRASGNGQSDVSKGQYFYCCGY